MKKIDFPKFDFIPADADLSSILIKRDADTVSFWYNDIPIAALSSSNIIYEGERLPTYGDISVDFTALVADIAARLYQKPVRFKTMLNPPVGFARLSFYEDLIIEPFAGALFEYGQDTIGVYVDAYLSGELPDIYLITCEYKNSPFIGFIYYDNKSTVNEIPENALFFAVKVALISADAANFTGGEREIKLLNDQALSFSKRFLKIGLGQDKLQEIYDFLKYT
ncbi:MAG: hypothetical protein ABIK73_07805 [candidate division WOR-3 bacterium]